MKLKFTETLYLLIYHNYVSHAYSEDATVIPIAASKDKDVLDVMKEHIEDLNSPTELIDYLLDHKSGSDVLDGKYFETLSDMSEDELNILKSSITKYDLPTKHGTLIIVQIPLVEGY